MNYIKNKRGISLIEVIMTLSLISIIITSLFTIFINDLRTNNKINNKIYVQDKAKELMDMVVKDSLSATRISDIEQSTNNTSCVEFQLLDNKFISFVYDENTNVVKVGAGRVSEVINLKECSKNIKRFKITEIDRGFKINIISFYKDEEFQLINTIYFRN